MRSHWLYILILTGFGYVSNAQVIHIPADQPTIQAGIDAAGHGDTVLIAEGTYYENINFRGKAITVASYFLIDGDTNHIARTIINGSQSINPDTFSVVMLCSGEDTTSILAGLTITGGKGTRIINFHMYGSYIAGGGIIILNSGGKIIHNIIEKNHLVSMDTLRGILGCGLLISVNNYHTAIIRNNIIRNNSGTGEKTGAGGWGGGASLHGGRILLEYNSIVNNTLYVNDVSAGAGIFFENEFFEGTIEEATIRNNFISKNASNSDNNIGIGSGLAISIGFNRERVQIYNNIICNNYTEGYGGAMYFYFNNSNIYNNIIFDNVATMHTDQLAMDEGSDVWMKNNIVWSGNIWLATHYGLVKIIPGQVNITGFNNEKGIPIIPFTNSFCIDPMTGKIYIGEENGMISFQADRIPLNAFIAPMVIMDFRYHNLPDAVSDTAIQEPLISLSNRMDLSYKENFLQFTFTVLDFNHPRRKQYKYYMHGLDPDTISAGPYQTTIYRNLKPGKYSFWTSEINKDETLNPENLILDIYVHPPWYRSTVAQSGYILVMIFLVVGYIRLRTGRLRKEKMVLERLVEDRTAELRQKNEQIIEMEKLKTRFFTDISHEIRTPLSLITGPLDNLIKQEHTDPRTNSWLAMIRRSSQRLLQLVNQLLDISRLDAGHMKLVLEESDVMKHLRILVEEYVSMAESRIIRFITDIPGSVLITWYDREKVHKITSNLLSNAFKFTPENGTVTCRVKILKKMQELPYQMLRIIVADTGRGIPINEREKIFERFYRAEGDLYEDAGGTGIGLSLTKELINLMYGEIAVKSLEGTGTVFIVTIPMGKEHLKDEEYILKEPAKQEPEKELLKREVEPVPVDKEISDQSTEVLIIEDNKDLRTYIRENLSDIYKIREAGDGIEGLKLAQSKIPDLIISDVMMPGIDGMELCRNLKNDELTSHIPIIILTAKATGKDKIGGLELGADDYIYKPFSMEELKARIKNLLEQRERLRKKYSSMVGMDWGKMSVTTLDEQFLKKATGVISENMQDFNFNVGVLQNKMSISREHLFRKMKALTGESPSNLIRVMRLKTAAAFMEKGDDNITIIAMNAGFSNLSYFARCFRKYYGKTPQEFKREFNKNTSMKS